MTSSTSSPGSILWLNQLDPAHPWAGGAERHITEVGRRLVARGTSVTVVSERFSDLPAEEERDGLRIVRPVRRGLLHAWALAHARQLVERFRVDAVVGDLSKVVPWGRKTFGGRPMVTVVRHFNARQLFLEVPFPGGPVLWAVERFTPWWLRSAPLLTESCDTAGVLARLGARPSSIVRIPPGVDTRQFHPDATRRSATPLLAYVGRLKRYKRVDMAIRAFAVLRREWPDAEFEIAGVGSEAAGLRSLSDSLGLGGSVRFLGGIPVDQVVELYQRAWVHVQPSAAEGWGLTAIESMACGTPVVAFRGGSLAETVGPVCSELLAERPTEPSLARAMARGLQRAATSLPMAESRLVEYASQFSWDATADHYATVLAALAAGRPVGRALGAPSPGAAPEASAERRSRGTANDRAGEPSASG